MGRIGDSSQVRHKSENSCSADSSPIQIEYAKRMSQSRTCHFCEVFLCPIGLESLLPRSEIRVAHEIRITNLAKVGIASHTSGRDNVAAAAAVSAAEPPCTVSESADNDEQNWLIKIPRLLGGKLRWRGCVTWHSWLGWLELTEWEDELLPLTKASSGAGFHASFGTQKCNTPLAVGPQRAVACMHRAYRVSHERL